MGKVILVRHGDLVRGDNKDDIDDNLSDKAKKFAKRLPVLLKQNGYINIDKVYYDNSKKYVPKLGNKKEIERCFQTIKHFSVDKRIPYNKNNIKISMMSFFI